MIGCEYRGQIHYISKLEDFREVMEPSVYDALIKAFEGGIIENHQQKYEDLKRAVKAKCSNPDCVGADTCYYHADFNDECADGCEQAIKRWLQSEAEAES